jgi:serine/threonine-protein kinase
MTTPSSAFASTFQAVWQTLPTTARAAVAGATLRLGPLGTLPLVGRAAPAAAGPSSAKLGVSLGQLPRISIDWHERLPTSPLEAAAASDIVATSLLGEGGMGRVLLGRQHSLDRDVAIKTVRDATSATLADALVAEGMLTGYLEHPNIIPVHALGFDEAGQPVLVMKRVTGVSWSDLLSSPDHESWAKLAVLSEDRLRAHIEILMQVARAVSYAHSKGVLHRDIKPDNVMLGEFGEVYLVDFGVALRVRDGEAPVRQTVGTPCFMAPELLDPTLPLGPRTDVYLLAATLHTILTGRPRHDGSTIFEVFQSAFASVPVDYGDLPEELAQLCNDGTRRDPAERVESALAFYKRLDEFLAHRGSNLLSAVAEERLQELSRVETRDVQAAARLGAECRFSYQMALRQWPDSLRAKAGLRRCLEQLLAIEVRRENLDAAQALLDELGEASDEQHSLVRRLQSALADRKRDAAALQALAHDLDLGVARRQRAAFLAVIGGLVVVLWVVSSFLRHAPGRGSDLPMITLLGFVGLAGLLLGVGLLRKELGRNVVNRRLTLLVSLTASLLCLNRVEAWLANASVASTLAGDLLVLCLSASAAAVFVERAWALGAILTGLGSLASVLFPDVAHHTFSAALLALICNVLLTRTDKPRAPSSPAAA